MAQPLLVCGQGSCQPRETWMGLQQWQDGAAQNKTDIQHLSPETCRAVAALLREPQASRGARHLYCCTTITPITLFKRTLKGTERKDMPYCVNARSVLAQRMLFLYTWCESPLKCNTWMHRCKLQPHTSLAQYFVQCCVCQHLDKASV